MFDAKAFLKTLTSRPGVYLMRNIAQEVIYVGKAKNLKNRVSSYFQKNLTSIKTQNLVQNINSVEVIVTHTENEALILENNLIKEHRPRYNVLFRDDKSYPYLYLSDDVFPRLDLYRGAKQKKGNYFGPYPSVMAVRETLNILQKIFRLRQCDNHFFRSRTRPCLQYQIQRCTAPCVNYVTEEQYQQNVKNAILFLQGKNQQLIADLVTKMELAATQLDFELAANLRDQIANLRKVQEQQYVDNSAGNTDVIASASEGDRVCVHILTIRAGRLLGNRTFFPKAPANATSAEIITAFIPQYYLNSIHDIPEFILTTAVLAEKELLESVLSEQAKRKINLISSNVRGERARWLKMAEINARQALAASIANSANTLNKLVALQDALTLDHVPERMECFDISHTMGEATVASCVVFGKEGTIKSDYRRFNIAGITPGDDFAAMEQALTRRYTRIKAEEGKLPDLLIIDGGKGQLGKAKQVLEELQISGITLLGIAKGKTRKPGFEMLFMVDRDKPILLSADEPALHVLQQVRDEAHRFAITGHRNRRDKARMSSVLEDIQGIGAKRRRALLQHFGGLQGIRSTSVDDLAKVPGISRDLAERIYATLHGK